MYYVYYAVIDYEFGRDLISTVTSTSGVSQFVFALTLFIDGVI